MANMPDQRVTWIEGKTLAVLPGLVNGKVFYYVDDEEGGRSAATDLEVALWKLAFGSIPLGTNAPIGEYSKPKKKAKK
jgi:hypothetical protein